MTAPVPTPDAVLRLCGTPEPWFPSEHARATGVDRDALDEPLARLRLAGLVRIGGWEAGKGQWYVVTDAGRAALADPRALAGLGQGNGPVPVAAVSTPRPGRLTTWDRGEAVRKALFAPGGTPMTWGLLVILVGVFGVGLALALRRGIQIETYFKTGLSPVQVWLAVAPGAVGLGEWWRLLSYSLVHGGLLHLLMNSAALIALGPLMERAIGSVRFLVLWVLGALGGGVAVVLGGSAAIGASGALCALLTAAVAFIWLNRRHLGPDVTSEALRRLSTTIILTVLISLSPGISWQGHLGGAVSGLVAGVLLTYHRFGTREQRWAALLGLVLLPIAGLAPVVERRIIHFRSAGPSEPADFQHRVASVVQQVLAHASAVSDDLVDPLRYQPPGQRDPAAVQHARAELAALGHEQLQAQAQATWAGPYHVPALEQARNAALRYIGARFEVTKALDLCLERGPAWAVSDEQATLDETRLQQRLNQALEAELHWRRLGRAAKELR